MKIKAILASGGRVDVLRFIFLMRNNMSGLWEAAVREFVNATASRVHVDTGMSKASLLPAAQGVKYTVGISPRRPSAKGYNHLGGGYDPAFVRNIQAGHILGQRAFKLDFGSRTGKYSFEFEIVVYQWAVNEDKWDALEAGGKAMLDFITANIMKAVPPIDQWINKLPTKL